ncbi:MAG TPA: type IV pilin protein [Steroidobacteraceae bacterium]|jgi:type IV pilus assembly protein PilE|nr:type IV pilin protein [Steroidobacteraceae bacterium]
MSRRIQHGFTLVELMITVVIVSILLGIAVPSYRQYVIRSKRTAAQAVMMDIANHEQQFLLANRAYADKATLEANGYVVPADVSDSYSWNVVPGTGASPSFAITFTATGGQAADGALTLTSAGDKSPPEKWQK